MATPPRKPRFSKVFLAIAITIVVVIPFIGSAPLFQTPTGLKTWGESALWGLATAIIRLRGGWLLGMKNPRGWLYLAGGFYASCWSNQFSGAWMALVIAGTCLWFYHQWTNPKSNSKA